MKTAKASSPPENHAVCRLPGFLPGMAPDDCLEIARSRTVKTAAHSDTFLDSWLRSVLQSPKLKASTIPLQEMRDWEIDVSTGNIGHVSDKFFSLTGIKVRHRTPMGEINWDQPIIDQPEIGVLGIICKKIKGVLHFCLQAKEEPGNINSVQLSPTVQATYSNYTRVHGGSCPRFIEYFMGPERGRIIFSKLQTEDGGRFLFKSNRNMLVQVADDEVPILPDGFIWVTLRQIGLLLRRDNLVHACTRSILSALLFPRDMSGRVRTPCSLSGTSNDNFPSEVIQWLDDHKSANHFLVKRRGLNELSEWSMDRDGSFSHEEARFFRVIGIDVESREREVTSWNQPILDNPGTGIIGLLTKVREGELHFLMQAKAEPGNRAIVQVGPTAQFTPGNYIGNNKLPKPFLFDEFNHPERLPLLYESTQSEEGARFYKESHLYRVLTVPEGVEIRLPAEFRWISASTIHFLISLGETVNSCARSALALMLCEQQIDG